MLTKDPGTATSTPWHHDQSYYPVDGDDVVSLWMPVDPVDRAQSAVFVEGSHRWGRWFVPRRFDNSKPYTADQQLMESGWRRVSNVGVRYDRTRIVQYYVIFLDGSIIDPLNSPLQILMAGTTFLCRCMRSSLATGRC